MEIRPQIWLLAALGLMLALGVGMWGSSSEAGIEAEPVTRIATRTEARETPPSYESPRALRDTQVAGQRETLRDGGSTRSYASPEAEERRTAARNSMRDVQRRGAKRAQVQREWERLVKLVGLGGSRNATSATSSAAPGSTETPGAQQDAYDDEYGSEATRYVRSTVGQRARKPTPGTCSWLNWFDESC